MTRTLVVGTGRSGTGYCAALLRAAGVDCGHEEVWTARAALTGAADWGHRTAECSWMAVPHLPAEVERGTRVVLVVRHPLDVVKSLLDIGFFDSGHDWRAVVATRCPVVFTETAYHDRAMSLWCNWNHAAETWADEVVRIEDIDAGTLTGWSGASNHVATAALATVPRDVNAKNDEKAGDWASAWGHHRAPLATLARSQAERYGYRP